MDTLMRMQASHAADLARVETEFEFEEMPSSASRTCTLARSSLRSPPASARSVRCVGLARA
jgi:hypothetical protein